MMICEKMRKAIYSIIAPNVSLTFVKVQLLVMADHFGPYLFQVAVELFRAGKYAAAVFHDDTDLFPQEIRKKVRR